MKRHLSLFTFLVSSFVASAQSDFDFVSALNIDTNISSKVILHSRYYYSSNAITNRFAQEYETKGFITDEMKDEVSKKLSDKNLLGAGFEQNLFFVFHPDSSKKNITAFAGISNKFHSDSKFPRDLFELVFRGNKSYAGKTADLSDFEFNSYNYRQFTAGMGKDFVRPHSKIYVGAAVNVVQGVRFNKIKSGHTTLYTQPDGEYLDGDFDVTIQRDDSASAKFLPSDGTGFSGDLFFSFESETGNIFSAAFEDFGNIRWNKYSSTVRIDTSFSYSGIDVSDLFIFNDSVSTQMTVDSTYYQNFLTNRKKERVTTQLPFSVRFAYMHPFKNIHLDVTAGVGLLLYTNATPNYFASGNYHLNKKNEIALMVSYGGFAKFNAGISVAHHFAHGFSVHAGSNYISSMINYNKGTSQGAFVSFEKKF
jgi:hypothetical protein